MCFSFFRQLGCLTWVRVLFLLRLGQDGVQLLLKVSQVGVKVGRGGHAPVDVVVVLECLVKANIANEGQAYRE